MTFPMGTSGREQSLERHVLHEGTPIVGILQASYQLDTGAWQQACFGGVEQSARLLRRILGDATCRLRSAPSATVRLFCTFFVEQGDSRLEGLRSKAAEELQRWLEERSSVGMPPLETEQKGVFHLIGFLTASPEREDDHLASVSQGPSSFGDLPFLRSLRAEADAVHAPVVRRFQEWFATLEGKTFETYKDAEETIDLIKYFARLAGLQLLYQDRPVTIQCASSPRSKRATFQVRSHAKGRRKNLYNGTALPHLDLGRIPTENKQKA